MTSALAYRYLASVARDGTTQRLQLAQEAALAAHERVEGMHTSFRDDAVELALASVEVSRDGYLEGVSGLLPLIDAQRLALEVQERLIEIRTLRWRRALRLAAANGVLLELLEVTP